MFPGLKAIPALNGAGSTGSGAGGALTFSFVASATSEDSTITIPASAIAGDFAILFDAAEGQGASISSVVPAGWTSIVDTFAASGSRSIRSLVSYRKLVAAGGGSITGMNADGETKIMLVFRPSSSISSTVVSTWNAEMTSGDPASQTVSASGVATPLIVFAFATKGETGTALPAFTTETPAMTNVTKFGTAYDPEVRLGYTIYNSSPSNQSIDIGDNGAMNGLQSGYVRFT